MAHTELDGMYQEILMEHSRDPHNFGVLDAPDLKADGFNPLCGDKICIHAQLSHEGPEKAGTDKISSIRFKGQACSICMASASILTDEAMGKTLPELQALIQNFRDLMQDKKQPSDFEGDITCLAGVKKFPVRIKCALLPWTTLKEALDERGQKGAAT